MTSGVVGLSRARPPQGPLSPVAKPRSRVGKAGTGRFAAQSPGESHGSPASDHAVARAARADGASACAPVVSRGRERRRHRPCPPAQGWPALSRSRPGAVTAEAPASAGSGVTWALPDAALGPPGSRRLSQAFCFTRHGSCSFVGFYFGPGIRGDNHGGAGTGGWRPVDKGGVFQTRGFLVPGAPKELMLVSLCPAVPSPRLWSPFSVKRARLNPGLPGRDVSVHGAGLWQTGVCGTSVRIEVQGLPAPLRRPAPPPGPCLQLAPRRSRSPTWNQAECSLPSGYLGAGSALRCASERLSLHVGVLDGAKGLWQGPAGPEE